MAREMTIYRRHIESCRYRASGRNVNRCRCPIWVDGVKDGKRYRFSLGTSDWKVASRLLAELEAGEKLLSRSVKECLEQWEASLRVRDTTKASYRQTIASFRDFCERASIRNIGDITHEMVEGWRNGLADTHAAVSVNRHHAVLLVFFGWLQTRNWMRGNPGKLVRKLKAPPSDREPFTQDERARLLAASDQIGTSSYERRRARAMLLLQFFTGLRISDVALLPKDRVADGRILLWTRKTGERVSLPLPEIVLQALAALPEPRGAIRSSSSVSSRVVSVPEDKAERQEPPPSSRYFFWNGQSNESSQVKTCHATLEAVFRKAGFARTLTHRSRHTMASSVLAAGGTIEQVAAILGITPAVAYKHYVRYTPKFQQGLDALVEKATAMAPEPTIIEQIRPASREIQ